MPVYPPVRNQALVHEGGLPLLAFTISQTVNFIGQLTVDGNGNLAVDYPWTEEDGWKKSSVTYPDMEPGSEFVVHKIHVDDIPEQYWSLKHCYIK